MCKEVGQSRVAATPEIRRAWGLVIWESGGIFRPGKTRREHENGTHNRHLQNREAKRRENRGK